MPSLSKLLDPRAYLRFTRRQLLKLLQDPPPPPNPNMLGTTRFPPGHFYSPLLDLKQLSPEMAGMPFDGAEDWEHLDLLANEQKAYYADLIANYPEPVFPTSKAEGFRYYTDNDWFRFGDSFTLSRVILKEKPRRIVEVGSGFSSAVMLDTTQKAQLRTDLTCIEPNPERLNSLLTSADTATLRVIQSPVQEVAISTFDQLGPGDILFIDSSHVVKAGSDVAHLILRVLPRLQSGVIVHVHDIMYPYTYPIAWIREGTAWNESLFLRAFLINN